MAGPSGAWSGCKQSCADPWEPFPRAHPRSQTASYDALGAKRLEGGNPETRGYSEDRCWQCGQGKPLVALRCQAPVG